MGGIPRRSAETGSHIVRPFAERQRERKATYASVFLDAVAAFCSVVRDALWAFRTLRCTRELSEEFGLTRCWVKSYDISFKWSLQRQK